MDTKQIASRLAELCAADEFVQAQEELYGEDVVSIEQNESKDFPKEIKGKEAVLAKIRKFNSMVEESFGTKVSPPLISGKSFAFILTMDVKMKGKERMTMEEICLYETKEGKVISERFFM